ncbi:polyprotein, partial [Aduncisulcus paluster]
HRTVPYHPESNGIVERANRELLRILRYILDGADKWVASLPVIQFILNTSYHSATGTTPFKLVMGRDEDPRKDLFVEQIKSGGFKDYDECIVKLEGIFKKIRKAACDQQEKVREKTQSEDPLVRPTEGSFVWLKPV